MVVRIRFAAHQKALRRRGTNRRVASATGALLAPVAAIAASLAIWRVAADLNLARSFAISSGLFSHWQVWLGGAVLLHLCSRVLNRYGRGGDAATS